MIRGTTPLHEIILPNDASNYKEVLLTFADYDTKDIIIEKKLSDMSVEGSILSFRFTQEETLMFPEDDRYVKCQLRALGTNDHAYASSIFEVRVRDVLNDTVLGEEENEDHS